MSDIIEELDGKPIIYKDVTGGGTEYAPGVYIVGGSSGGGGGASTVADGADVAEGATTDAAVTAGSTGSVSGKLRQISSDMSSTKTNTANIPAKGAAVTSASTPVNIASDQTVPVSAAALPLPAGASTAANQTTANASMATVATNTGNIPAKGQATMTNSTPVVLASNQSTVPVQDSAAETSLATIATNSASTQPGVLTSATLQNAATTVQNGTAFAVSGMSTVRLTVTITGGTATLNMQGHEDSVPTWASFSVDRPNAVPGSTITASGVYTMKVAGLVAIQAQITAISGATVTVTAHAAPEDNAPFLPKDTNGFVYDTLGTLIAGEDLSNNKMVVEQRNSYTAISTAATTVVKSGAGFLHRIVVTGGTAGTIIIYDNTAGSGTQIANFDSTNALNSYEFNVTCSTGLTIVTSAATKLTVSWR